jgi:Tfp pilus assembly protein FimT
MVVIGIIAAIASFGIAAYSEYNNAQSLQSAARDVATMLNTAKSRSLSQVKPSVCGVSVLSGYQVDLSVGGRGYTLSVVCGGTARQVSNSMLPIQVIFSPGTTASLFFAISSGSVVAPATIKISGYNKTRTITISQTGVMSR